ncbi:ankyrin [Trichoderma citrinoviride]|uniref:Ankyrin n=1 Tax=Trichoderma citrinoviride TaxID=58853 RepID=A0A2T4B3I7_9HYPO|nr:ankyrin [Trichoderma citrinoviride]PTB63761.1 ankyrin [Trichoderma citrinoviride]
MSGRPLLVIPSQSASPSNQPISPNGRPATWSWSAQRKMARLYLFTTLPVDKIRAIVNALSPDRTIKQSSANKRLQLLFDKEPRWLHPRDEDDMERRVTELANSPVQLRLAQEARFPASPSDACSGSTVFGSDPVFESQESGYSFSNDLIPEQSVSHGWDNRDDCAGARPHDKRFAEFLRQTTCLTDSSANTTGTFRNHLRGRAEPYIKVVKRLVKRFTSLSLDRPGMSRHHSPRVVWDKDWIGDPEATDLTFKDFSLPGSLLYPNRSAPFGCDTGVMPTREDGAYRHQRHFDWTTFRGPPLRTAAIPLAPLTQEDIHRRDCYQHTVLHLLAARGDFQALYVALSSGAAAAIVNVQNTAGQTFMHLIRDDEGVLDDARLSQLIEAAKALGFNLLARDCFGRSSLHSLTLLSKAVHARCLYDLDPREYLQRDAFGFIPPVGPCMTDSLVPFSVPRERVLGIDPNTVPDRALDPGRSDHPAISQDSQLLQNIRVSMANRFHEDRCGNNGLHCLAMAPLSVGSLAERHDLDMETGDFRVPSHQTAMDSSEQSLRFRYETLQTLLDAGQDPNHRNMFGNTPLMAFAAALPEEDEYKLGPAILQLLVSRGADVNARNKRGETALHVAVRFHRKLAAKALVMAGANVDVRNSDQRSLLDVCDAHIPSEPKEYAKYLACRAWLSGPARAQQSPSFWHEWRVKGRVKID